MNGDRYVFESCKWSHSTVQSRWYLSRSVCWWMVTFATFQDIPVSIQMIKTLLFCNQILQVWYQNEEDIHLLPYDMLLIGLIWNISGKIGLLEVSRNFFCWVYLRILILSKPLLTWWFRVSWWIVIFRVRFIVDQIVICHDQQRETLWKLNCMCDWVGMLLHLCSWSWWLWLLIITGKMQVICLCRQLLSLRWNTIDKQHTLPLTGHHCWLPHLGHLRTHLDHAVVAWCKLSEKVKIVFP